MQQDNRNNLTILSVSSPAELHKQLESLACVRKQQLCFAELQIYGSGILIRQFDLPHLASRELLNALKLEAIELLSVPTSAIALDYQIMDFSGERIRGIFIAMPAERVREYKNCLRLTQVIPIKMTAKCISVLGEFLADHPEALKNNFCFLDFSKSNIINLAVFINGQCELIREIIYENVNDAEQAVLDSLKYSYGRSVAKKLNKLYFSGIIEEREDLIKSLEGKIEIEPKLAFAGGPSQLAKEHYHELFLRLNLLKKDYLIAPFRSTLLQTEKIFLTAGIVCCIALGINIIKGAQSIKRLQSSFSITDYEYARLLQEKLKVPNNGQ